MKHIEINGVGFSYPIGSEIKELVLNTDYYIDGFLSLNYPEKQSFNVWCRGSSGAILAGLFCVNSRMKHYNFTICHIKKAGENSHSSPLDCAYPDDINIVIDDFMSSGETIRAITDYMLQNGFNPDILIVAKAVKCPTLNLFNYVISHHLI